MLIAYLQTLLVTIVIEIPLALLVLWKYADWKWIVSAALLGNLLSHPLLHFVLPRYLSDLSSIILWGEIGVLVLESLIYALVARPKPRAWALSAAALANGVTYFVGVLWLG